MSSACNDGSLSYNVSLEQEKVCHEDTTARKQPPIPSFDVGQNQKLIDVERRSSTDTSSSRAFQSQGDSIYSQNEFAPDGVGAQHESSEFFLGEDASLSSSSVESSDSEEEEEEPTSLQERAIRNRHRNDEFLQGLHEKYAQNLPPKPSFGTKSSKRPAQITSDMETRDVPRGMLRKLTRSSVEANGVCDLPGKTLSERFQILLNRYPHRDIQIRRLASLLHVSACTGGTVSSGTVYHVPAPLLVSGPRGTGKTSVVRDLVTFVREEMAYRISSVGSNRETGHVDNPLGTAYINCITLEPSSVERLVLEAYRQLRPENRFSRRRRKVKGLSRHISSSGPNSGSKPHISGDNDNSQQGNALPDTETTSIPEPPKVNISAVEDQPPRLQPSRAAKRILSSINHNPPTRTKATNIVDEEHGPSSTVSVEMPHSALAAFGRSLQRFYGSGSSRSAILVLDHAERLLSFSGKRQANERSNCLAELLLLPKVMRLNLTIVVISSCSILQRLRLNNTALPEKSMASLSSVGMVTVEFPAYKTTEEIQNVLKVDHLLRWVVGIKFSTQAKQDPFKRKVVDSFLHSLAQVLIDTTRDLNDFIRLGRTLWHVYIQPLQNPENIERTLGNVDQDAKLANSVDKTTERDVINRLGHQFMQKLAKVAGSLTQLSLDSPIQSSGSSSNGLPTQPAGFTMPYFRSCLLLAAFICQHNRTDKDKQIFSVHGNGKRRRKEDTNTDENLAFGSAPSDIEQLKSLRPRPFLVERVISICHTLVRLNPDGPNPCPGRGPIEYSTESLGSVRFYNDLWQLVDHGYLHPVGFSGAIKSEQINLNGAKFWCSLTKNEALDIATVVGIPLDNYLV